MLPSFKEGSLSTIDWSENPGAGQHDINPLVLDALAQVLALEPVSFIYNEGDGRVRYCFIAEDTAAVDEHLATHDASGTVSGIDDDDRSIVAVLVSAVKDLYAKVQEYFARTERLEECVSALEAQLAGSAAAGAPAIANEAPAGSTAPVGTSTDAGATSTPPTDSPPPADVQSPANDTAQPPSAEQSRDDNQPSADVTNHAGLVDAPAEAPAVEPAAAANGNSPAEELPATGTE